MVCKVTNEKPESELAQVPALQGHDYVAQAISLITEWGNNKQTQSLNMIKRSESTLADVLTYVSIAIELITVFEKLQTPAIMISFSNDAVVRNMIVYRGATGRTDCYVGFVENLEGENPLRKASSKALVLGGVVDVTAFARQVHEMSSMRRTVALTVIEEFSPASGSIAVPCTKELLRRLVVSVCRPLKTLNLYECECGDVVPSYVLPEDEDAAIEKTAFTPTAAGETEQLEAVPLLKVLENLRDVVAVENAPWQVEFTVGGTDRKLQLIAYPDDTVDGGYAIGRLCTTLPLESQKLVRIGSINSLIEQLAPQQYLDGVPVVWAVEPLYESIKLPAIRYVAYYTAGVEYPVLQAWMEDRTPLYSSIEVDIQGMQMQNTPLVRNATVTLDSLDGGTKFENCITALDYVADNIEALKSMVLVDSANLTHAIHFTLKPYGNVGIECYDLTLNGTAPFYSSVGSIERLRAPTLFGWLTAPTLFAMTEAVKLFGLPEAQWTHVPGMPISDVRDLSSGPLGNTLIPHEFAEIYLYRFLCGLCAHTEAPTITIPQKDLSATWGHGNTVNLQGVQVERAISTDPMSPVKLTLHAMEVPDPTTIPVRQNAIRSRVNGELYDWVEYTSGMNVRRVQEFLENRTIDLKGVNWVRWQDYLEIVDREGLAYPNGDETSAGNAQVDRIKLSRGESKILVYRVSPMAGRHDPRVRIFEVNLWKELVTTFSV